jgi:hypothetical protein
MYFKDKMCNEILSDGYLTLFTLFLSFAHKLKINRRAPRSHRSLGNTKVTVRTCGSKRSPSFDRIHLQEFSFVELNFKKTWS